MTPQEEFIEIYNKYITRQGADELLEWLKRTDFFTAPASSKYHCACENGLVMHSVSVFNTMMESTMMKKPTILKVLQSADFFTICARLSSIRFQAEMLRMKKQVSGKKFRIMQLKTSFPTVTVKSPFFSLNAKCTLKLMRLWQFVGIWVNLVTKTATQSVRHMTNIRLP